MKVLVTGGTGFLGQHIVPELLRKNCAVTIAGRNEEKVKLNWKNRVEFKYLDLNETISKNFFEKSYDLLVHLAWEGLPNYKSSFHLEKNLRQNEIFLGKAVEQGIKKMIVAGTCLEYGFQSGCLTEDLETKPHTPYGEAKDRLRKFLFNLQKTNSFTLQWIRFFYLFGPGQRSDSLLGQLLSAIERGATEFPMSPGDQRRDYLPIEKAAELFSKLALTSNHSGVFNCCSGNPIAVKDFVQKMMSERNVQLKLNLGTYSYQDYEPFEFWGDPSKLLNALVS